MDNFRFRIQLFGVAILVFSFALPGHTAERTKHVVELFTSQGCYSCPPADALLGKIIDEHDDVIALEFHVDYWNSLVYGSAGKWIDPFSNAEYSQRQRAYNTLRMKGRSGVYTPQMVVDGRYAFVGSQRSKAKLAIRKDSTLVLDVTATVSESGVLEVNVDGDYSQIADIWLVTFDRKHVTDVKTGENHGKTMVNFNVVRDLKFIGKWQGTQTKVSAAAIVPDENHGCAVIVQQYDERKKRISGEIIGAARCELS